MTREEAIHILDAAPSVTPKQRVGRWIPIIERLPERDVLVLCSIRDGCSDYRVIISKNDGAYWWNDGTIEAWMPLPEPYKAESEE